MKGLMIKDICLMTQRKTTLLLFMAMAFIMSFSMDGTFLISYFCMIGSLLSMSTISYDEYDNGYSFLMTLPITPKLYTVEKYVFGAASMLVCMVFATVLQIGSDMIQHVPFVLKDMLLSDLIFFPVFLLILGLYIPIQFKFGADKGRIALFGLFGIVFVLFTFGQKIVTNMNVQSRQNLINLLLRLNELPSYVIVAIAGVIVFALMALSISISIRIMEKKEF